MTQPNRDSRIFVDQSRFPKVETRMVAETSSFLRRRPRPTAPAETELLYGTLFHIHKQGRGWVWGQAECQLPGRKYPGYVGWVPTRHLGKKSRPTHKITSLNAPVFKDADIKSPVRFHLPLSATVAGESGDRFLKTPLGFIHNRHLQSISAISPFKDWIAVAESLLGQPYVWGGLNSTGLDCSGLVQTALRVMGRDIPRDTDQQVEMGRAVPVNDDLSGLKRGDLVFWKGHVGIMRSSTELVHANAFHMAVASEPLAAAVKRIGDVTAIRRLRG